MAKQTKTVRYTLIEDGIRPGQAPWGAAVRNQLEISVEPGRTSLIRLGIAFDCPFLVYPAGTMELLIREGRIRVDFPSAAAAGILHNAEDELKMSVTNISDSTVRVEERASVAHAVFLAGIDSLEKR